MNNSNYDSVNNIPENIEQAGKNLSNEHIKKQLDSNDEWTDEKGYEASEELGNKESTDKGKSRLNPMIIAQRT